MALRIPLQASPAACAALGSKVLPRALGTLLRNGVRAVLSEQGVTSAEVSLTLLGDAEIASLNAEYLGHEGPTDVLSFALYERPEPVLGDIYLGVPSAGAAAEARGLPLAHELIRLAVHGTLHLLGHDHPAGRGRTSSRMWRLQERIVAEVLAP